MALTEEDKKEVLDLIRKENKEQQKKAAASSESFGEWLEKKLPDIELVVRSAGLLIDLYNIVTSLISLL